MATRNRTFLYQKYRDALRSVPASSGSLSRSGSTCNVHMIGMVRSSILSAGRSYTPLSAHDPGSSSTGSATVDLPHGPAWVDVSEEIAANVQHVRVKITELSKAHAKALMPCFGDGKEDQRLIESLTQEITGLIRISEKKLQKLPTTGASEDLNLRKNIQRSLAQDLQSLSGELRKKQSAYMKRLRQLQEGQDRYDLEMSFHGRSRSKIEDNDSDEMEFHEQQMARVRKSEGIITAEREKEIQQVAESVTEIAQIMKDLSVLVIDQGTIVDRIDHNIHTVASTVEKGLKELQKAERRQKEGPLVKCATILVIMCFVMLILLILKEVLLS